MVKTGAFAANGSSDWFLVERHPVHIAINGTFGPRAVAIEQDVQGAASTVLDNGTAIGVTANNNSSYNFQAGDTIRLTLSGATTPDLNYKISGVV